MKKIRVALIGSPNVGKSTIYNALTNNHEHTGNWAGKTVENVSSECVFEGVNYTIFDLPGTYSLISKSKEEMVATDFIFKGNFDVAVVVCDATSLEKGINLVVQVQEMSKKVVVALNLWDEALKKGINIDVKLLEKNLGCPVVVTSARKKEGLEELLKAIEEVKENDYIDINYGILNKEIEKVEEEIKNYDGNKRWVALRILEGNKHYLDLFRKRKILDIGLKTKEAKEALENVDIPLEIVINMHKMAKLKLKNVVSYKNKDYDLKTRKIDKILTSKIWGIPIMLGMLLILFYITIVGANYPSDLLFKFFASLEPGLTKILDFILVPPFLREMLVNGVYKTLYWVVSVMMPPMMIFFPLFTFLEDLGVLPRIAFNMDKAFSKCNACGKQALTMCMGIGCNAVGVTGARIIDSKYERYIAIITNAFMPCNGKFPTLIAIITMFFVGLNKTMGSFICALILTGFILLGILFTFLVSFILAKTVFRGEATSFTLELPPYRKPNIFQVIVSSVKNRAIFVLQRAIKVAIFAGALIWVVANVKVGGVTIMNYLIKFFNPVGVMLGVDGVVILSLILGFPANEIVIPALLMSYLKTSSLVDMQNMVELKNILVLNGWTVKFALSFLALMMFHYPCSTTMLTIKKETGSNFYTFLAFIIPLVVGIILAIGINIIL